MSSTCDIHEVNLEALTQTSVDLSVVIVSYNTRDVLRRCLKTLEMECGSVSFEILLVDNGSRDGSLDMVSREFPSVRVVQSGKNLGFAAANNLMFPVSRGKYTVLLNSDAFLQPGSLENAIKHMDAEPKAGLGGGRLIGEDGSWQPSSRLFPSMLNDLLTMSGLAHKFPKSRFWGRADRTWADHTMETATDWVPGAFSIIRSSLLQKIGGFDEAFFLYFEEVDLCKRIQAEGFQVRYWPDVVVVHLGGESSKSMPDLLRSSSGAQLTLWRLRSQYLYYRKHHGFVAWQSMTMEWTWHYLRSFRNQFSARAEAKQKVAESKATMTLIRRAWSDTKGGRLSPTRPW